MSGFLKSSIGRKLVMSISGLFLIVFLLVHLTANLFLLAGADAFNIGVHFMDTNPIVQIMQPVLALGFLIHIIYASMLTLQNRKATPVKYNTSDQKKESKWVARNMFTLGFIVFAFLVMHLMQFFATMKFGTMQEVPVDGVKMHDAYKLVAGLFMPSQTGFMAYIYSILYALAGIALGMHLHHGFWSAFQTIGWSNDIWKKRISTIGDIFAIVIAAGFTIIPLYFVLFHS